MYHNGIKTDFFPGLAMTKDYGTLMSREGCNTGFVPDCLRFSYAFNVNNTFSLNVYVTKTTTGSRDLLWSLSATPIEHTWYNASVPIQSNEPFTVEFEAVRLPAGFPRGNHSVNIDSIGYLDTWFALCSLSPSSAAPLVTSTTSTTTTTTTTKPSATVTTTIPIQSTTENENTMSQTVQSSSYVGVIVGSIIAVIILIAVLVALMILYRRKKLTCFKPGSGKRQPPSTQPVITGVTGGAEAVSRDYCNIAHNSSSPLSPDYYNITNRPAVTAQTSSPTMATTSFVELASANQQGVQQVDRNSSLSSDSSYEIVGQPTPANLYENQMLEQRPRANLYEALGQPSPANPYANLGERFPGTPADNASATSANL
jgi:hypothetical protein